MQNSIFDSGNILFIKDYKFENGNSKDKLLIILQVSETESYILQALTTSQDKVPDNKLHHGCTNSSNNLFSLYMFEKDRVVGQNGFKFHKNTFIHFQYSITKVNTSTFLKYFTDISIFDKLDINEYKRVIKCIQNSRTLSNKLKLEFQKIDLDKI